MIPIMELFGNTIQGEGPLVGTPAVFIRTFGCNLNCRGFGMPKGQLSTEADEIVASPEFENVEKLTDLPLAKTGCDSYPAIMPACMKFATIYSPQQLAAAIYEVAGKQDRLIVFTGGEPLVHQAALQETIFELYNRYGFRNFMFETNGTIKWDGCGVDDLMFINLWFSISPKTSNSGNATSKALVPKAVASYATATKNIYLKFVADADTDFNEIKEWVTDYEIAAGRNIPVLLMPEGGVLDERSRLNAKFVAEKCWEMNWRFTPREHLTIWGNAWAK